MSDILTVNERDYLRGVLHLAGFYSGYPVLRLRKIKCGNQDFIEYQTVDGNDSLPGTPCNSRYNELKYSEWYTPQKLGLWTDIEVEIDDKNIVYEYVLDRQSWEV